MVWEGGKAHFVGKNAANLFFFFFFFFVFFAD
jgi:hypothetical protein